MNMMAYNEYISTSLMNIVARGCGPSVCGDDPPLENICLIIFGESHIIRAGESASSWHRRWEPSEGPVSRSRAVYESFSDVGESRVWFASKNLTPCTMH